MITSNEQFLDKITLGDCRKHLPLLDDNSIDLLLSDIPYGINLDAWDVIHANTNSALLGQSPAQIGKSGFKRRGKPINGWSQADRNIGKEYQDWCDSWIRLVTPKLKSGASVLIFGARRTLHRVINTFEDNGFLLKDVLAWKKPSAHHRAQRVSIVFERRGLQSAAENWRGWRLGNLAPVYEPVAWFVKPYRIGGTVADNVLRYGVGAINIEECQIRGTNPTNMLEFGFQKNEERIHEAQKPLQLVEFLIKLTTKENQTILDPFMGSGTTAVAAKNLKRHFIGFEIVPDFHQQAAQRLGSDVQAGSGNPSPLGQTKFI
jgi:site-specific DNA-methyltransferase (adenine-specific)